MSSHVMNGTSEPTPAHESRPEQDSRQANAEMRALAMRRYHSQLDADQELAAAAQDSTGARQMAECFERGGTCSELLATACRAYSKRRAFGYSVGGAAEFSYLTYKELWGRVERLAAGACLASLFAWIMLPVFFN